MINENLDAFLEDFGVAVVFGEVEGLGILDSPDDIIGGLSISSQEQLTLKTSVFSTLKVDDMVTVDSVTYKVRESFKRIGDGRFGIVLVSNTES